MHIQQFIKGSIQKGYKGTVTDIVQLSLADCHRTTFGKFLSEGAWNINYAWKCIKKFVVREIIESSSSETPIFAIYDDTISKKTKPSSKDVINAHFKKGYHLIGIVKANRVIYPKGVSIQS